MTLSGLAQKLLSPAAVRERAAEMLEVAVSDRLPHFRVDLAQLDIAASFVAEVIRENYPDLIVPLHARWRHFMFGKRDLWSEIDVRTMWEDRASRARSAFDLVVISVLLDAGAGPGWTYRDRLTGFKAGRSEGLALASLRMFETGTFSSDPRSPLRADAHQLAELTAGELARGFQVDAANPLAGLEGRAALIASLGRTVASNSAVFATRDAPRPGGLFDHFAGLARNGALPAPAILNEVLTHLGPIWPGRLALGGIPLGDSWRHPAIKRSDASDGLVPLHKLSQWLSYSLIEPLQEAGITVTEIDGLTGLAEYRNGGLFLDLGVLALRDSGESLRPHPVESELVVEWRALTVALLDRLAPLVREKLGVTSQNFPLGCILQGGTWPAGRKLAKRLRADGEPPLTVVSDGTVF